MGVKSKLIPEVLTVRYDRLEDLRKAEDLLSSLESSSIATDNEKDFVKKRIAVLNSALNESRTEAERIINSLSHDVEAWNYTRLHFIEGYPWIDISFSLKISVDTVKTRVYRAFKRLEKSNCGDKAE